MSNRIGILGGTFDPIHLGHLHIALRSIEFFSLEQVFLVVARTPPHKRSGRISSAFHRFAMTVLATVAHPALRVSDVELEAGASPYTIDTLRAICRERHLQPRNLYFLAGGDSFQYIRTWKEYETLLTTFNSVFVERPGASMGPGPWDLPPEITAKIEDLRGNNSPPSVRLASRGTSPAETRIYLVDFGAPDCSSTAVRESSKSDHPLTDQVPPAVAQYISKYRLYPT